MSTPVKILLVEDDAPYAYLVERLLRDIAPDALVITRLTAREGLEEIGRDRPDLILLDLALPTLSGLEFLFALRRQAEDVVLPVIVLTGVRGDSTVYAAYYEYANAVVEKPETVECLRATLEALHEFWFRVALLPSGMTGRHPTWSVPRKGN